MDCNYICYDIAWVTVHVEFLYLYDHVLHAVDLSYSDMYIQQYHASFCTLFWGSLMLGR